MIILQVANDLDVFEKMLNSIDSKLSENAKFILPLIVVVSINIVIGIISLLTQIHLKNKDVEIHKINIRENKKIDVLEKVFQELIKLKNYDRTQTTQLISSILSIERLCQSNGLYIDKRMNVILNSILDYFKTIATNFRNKDIKKESKLFDDYTRAFNR